MQKLIITPQADLPHISWPWSCIHHLSNLDLLVALRLALYYGLKYIHPLASKSTVSLFICSRRRLFTGLDHWSFNNMTNRYRYTFTMYYFLWICFHRRAMRERNLLNDTERTGEYNG